MDLLEKHILFEDREFNEPYNAARQRHVVLRDGLLVYHRRPRTESGASGYRLVVHDLNAGKNILVARAWVSCETAPPVSKFRTATTNGKAVN